MRGSETLQSASPPAVQGFDGTLGDAGTAVLVRCGHAVLWVGGRLFLHLWITGGGVRVRGLLLMYGLQGAR